MRKYIYLTILLSLMATSSFGSNVKHPNVSGQFYPDNPDKLSAQIEHFFGKVVLTLSPKQHVEIIISPHAGYVFSGPVAAYGYKAVSQKPYKTVVIIAPSHYFGMNGFSVWEDGEFETPLGMVEVDSSFAKKLIAENPKFYNEPQAFDREHSLEVQIPFLQKSLNKDFKIVPIIAGQSNFELCEQLANSLNKLIADRKDVLVVISSDMSHFHNDGVARKMDQNTIQAIENFQIQEFWRQCRNGMMEMCGNVPVTVGMLLAKQRNLTPNVLKYGTSGDVTWDKSRVVGYVSIVFTRESEAGKTTNENKKSDVMNDGGGVVPLSLEQKKRLIEIAKKTIEQYVKTQEVYEVEETDQRLLEVEGAFVTIHKNGNLRGCIGNIIGQEPLYLTVRDMAIAACSQDPRFVPVKERELPYLVIEVSVLSKPRVTTNVEEIQMGVHGVIVSRGFRSGVFLPQVATETGWTKEEFLSNLCAQKAGLPPLAWKDSNTKIQIFTADVFSEEDVK